MVGDFEGKVRIFSNNHLENDYIRPKLEASIDIKMSVRHIHFHDFVPNFALVGSMSGDLIGILYKDITHRHGSYINEEDEPTQH